ncbi:MAG TPA: oligosaccharide flippase family protein [Gemmatimonadota bacterium]|nr:oligosaccharide flippase family protein [Gemmatimonadota bacterium]
MSSVIRTAARGTVMMMTAQVGLTLSAYVVAVILARELGPALYGVYGIVYSFLLGVELIGRFGIPQAASKLIAERAERWPGLEGTGMTLTAMIYLALFAAFWLLAPWLAELFHVAGGEDLFRIAALDIPFFGMYFICNHILGGRRSFGLEAAGIGLYALSKVAGILVLLVVGVTVTGALLVNVFSSAVALAFTASWVGRTSFRPTFEFGSELVRLGIPIGLFGVGSQILLSLDLWSLNAVGVLVSDEVKGWYVAATNVARIPNMVAFVMMAILIPSISRAAAMNDPETVKRSVRGATRFLVVTLLPASALIAVEAEAILAVLFSASYSEGAFLLVILIFSHGLLYTLLLTACAMLIAGGHARSAAVVTLSVLPVALILNIVMIRTSGAVGASLAALASIAIAASVAVALVHRRVAPLVVPRELLLAIVTAALIGALASWIRFEGPLLVVELALVMAAYAVALVGFGLVRREDLKLFLPVAGEERGGAPPARP